MPEALFRGGPGRRSTPHASQCPNRAAARAGRRVFADLSGAVAVAKESLDRNKRCSSGHLAQQQAERQSKTESAIDQDKDYSRCATSNLAPGPSVAKDTPADASRVTVCDAEEAILSAEEADIVEVAKQQLSEWDLMKEQFGLARGEPLSLSKLEEILEVVFLPEGVSYGLKQTSDNSSSTQSSVQETRPCSESEDAEETTPAPARLKCDVKSRPTDAKDPRIPPRPKIRRSSPRSQSLSAPRNPAWRI